MGGMEALLKIALKTMGFEPQTFIQQAQAFINDVYARLTGFDQRITALEKDVAEIKRMVAEIHAATVYKAPVIAIEDARNAG